MIKGKISNGQCTAFSIQMSLHFVFSLTAYGIEKEIFICQQLIVKDIRIEITNNMIIIECPRPDECFSIDVHDADCTLILKGNIAGLLCRYEMGNKQRD